MLAVSLDTHRSSLSRDPPLGYRTARHPLVYFRSRFLQSPVPFFPWRLYPGFMARWSPDCKRPARTTHRRWHGLRLLASDKTTLALPESKSLYQCFGAHKGQQGLGPIAVELCCLFDLISRAPLRFVFDKICTSEHKLIRKFIQYLKKGDLLLLDTGF